VGTLKLSLKSEVEHIIFTGNLQDIIFTGNLQDTLSHKNKKHNLKRNLLLRKTSSILA
jgi:hypothetical protein